VINLNIIVLDNREKVLSFLNPDLLDITETFQDGLRSIDVTYNIDELEDAKQWFQQGHKIYIHGDRNLTDCLYVLNTEVKQDLFSENQFSFTAEEVLVELNYAPFFTQSELSNKAFTKSQVQNETAITVNWNSLNYWFGDYFNIGIVQDCLSSYLSKITFNGSMSLMSLLRYIEEETGNVFVTRYEKDVNSNIVHRYLDFLNPVSMNKNWSCYFEYDFMGENVATTVDDSGDPYDDHNDDDYEDIETLLNDQVVNIDPENIKFRITHNGDVITTQDGTLFEWDAEDVGVTSETEHIAVQIRYYNSKVGIKLHNKSFTIIDDSHAGGVEKSYLETIADDPNYIDKNILLPNGCCFEFYDTTLSKVVYSRTLNPILSQARDDVLDLGYNVDNIEFSIDESDTFTAISPVLRLNDTGSGSNGLSTEDMGKIVKNWINLQVNKGDIIPMIVQRVTVTGTEEHPCSQRKDTARAPNKSAEQILGTYVLSSNYYSRPIKANDNTEGDNKSYEYWKGTAYWRAPFTKNKGEFHIELEDKASIEYPYIRERQDKRQNRAIAVTPKMGEVETSEENVYAIYNAVAMKLKDKKTPGFKITVDVANYRDGLLNDYHIHDRVYVKLPGTTGLVTAQVIKTVKSLHDLSDNKITLDNYSVNTKDITTDTYIDASNISFKYPKSKKLTVSLKNSTNDDEKLANKLITFTLYNVENGSSTLNGKVYTKKTDKNGQATITCKYDPGDYEMQISFGGDAEYTETSTTVKINVSGVKKVKKTNTNTTTTAKQYKNVKRFWSKYGESPDKKLVKAIGRPSADGELAKYKYIFWEAEYKNVCPKCNKEGTLFWDIFYAGNEHGDWGHVRKTGNGENGSAEGHIFCSNQKCDGDWSIFGKEHGYTNTRLKVHKKPKKSSKQRAYELRNGKMYYDTKKVEVKSKKVTSTKKRNVHGKVSSAVKKQALAIVEDSQGWNAAKKIAAWMDKNIHYAKYSGFIRSAEKVLSSKHGNCCDGTRLFFEMCDAAGCCDYLTLKYRHVYGHVYGVVIRKRDGVKTTVDNASDSHIAWGYICIDYRSASLLSEKTYPEHQPIYS